MVDGRWYEYIWYSSSMFQSKKVNPLIFEHRYVCILVYIGWYSCSTGEKWFLDGRAYICISLRIARITALIFFIFCAFIHFQNECRWDTIHKFSVRTAIHRQGEEEQGREKGWEAYDDDDNIFSTWITIMIIIIYIIFLMHARACYDINAFSYNIFFSYWRFCVTQKIFIFIILFIPI